MAHFAELDENNIVKRVIVVNNEVLLDENNTESEGKGIDFCKSLYGEDTNWKQTSYNAETTGFRKNYAGIGYTYNVSLDAFIAPQPWTSWTLNETTCKWEPPTAYPTIDLENPKRYGWFEPNQQWIEVAE
jgi:hypothetical protein